MKSDDFFKNFENYLFIYVKFLKDFARVHAVYIISNDWIIRICLE